MHGSISWGSPSTIPGSTTRSGGKGVEAIAADMMRTMLQTVGSDCGGDGEHIEEAQFVAFFTRIHARRQQKKMQPGGRLQASVSVVESGFGGVNEKDKEN